MFGQSMTLFRFAGIKVKVDFSWLFLAVLITWSLATGFFPARYGGLETTQYWAMGVFGALGLFVSIIFHEMAHSLVALRYGLPIRGITLFIFGGVAEMTKEPPHALAEFNIAIAGPLASLLLALVFWLSADALGAISIGFLISGVFDYLALLNGVLAIFNMVPAFPLDGGRVFRALQWQRTNDFAAATRTASRLGGYFGILLIVAGVVSFISGNVIGGLWWGMIGLFLKGAAQSAELEIGIRSVFANKPVALFMNADPICVSPNVSIEDLVEDYVYKYHYDLFPVVEHGALVGLVSASRIRQVPRETWAQTPVRSILEPRSDQNTISAAEDANNALSKMRLARTGRLLVVDDGKLVGILVLKDMLELLSLRAELEPGD